MQPAKPQTTSSSQTSWLSPPLLGAPTASQQTSLGAVMEGPLEYRVMLTPAFAEELIAHGHAVYFQSGFAARAGFPDQLYIQAGAQQCATKEQVYQNANIMLLVRPLLLLLLQPFAALAAAFCCSCCSRLLLLVQPFAAVGSRFCCSRFTLLLLLVRGFAAVGSGFCCCWFMLLLLLVEGFAAVGSGFCCCWFRVLLLLVQGFAAVQCFAAVFAVRAVPRCLYTPGPRRVYVHLGRMRRVYVHLGRMHACMHARVHACMHACMRACMHACMDACGFVLQVNPPSTEEYKYIRREQVLFSFVPFAATAQQQQQQRELLQALAAAAATLICYSSLVSSSNPTFAPVHYAVCCTAAYLGVQQAANLLANSEGLVFGQTPGAPPTSVLVLGGGPCGARAAAVAAAAGAQVTVMDSDLALLSRLSSSSSSSSSVRTLQYSQANLEAILPSTQVVFGCAIPAAGRAPVLLSEQQQQLLPAGAAAVDLAAAAGGNFAATKPGSIESPTYSSNGRCMYTATNICCLAPKSSSLSISHAAMPFVLQLASRGWKAAVLQFVGLQQGLFVAAGCCTSAFLAAATGCTYTPVEQLLQHEIQQLPQQQTAIAQLKQQLSTFRGQQQQGASFTVEA
ncbi:alanine dehydrogenase, putative [Eimeria necatrix]|uniref:Alanine dehydrogenase, putative n=1 Tax=Eimeria necatrix TaxID=51315 RepID=U6MQA2_9EIME|nr:alanine dehydrogenase, putative [Eimeria necatrix]CDJ63845.1 alanine dehydrogenase, putative [Eimeria necatrix]